MTSRKCKSFITIVPVGLWLLSNFLKWFANTLTFSSSLSARIPEDTLTRNNFGVVWWFVSSPVSRQMLTRAPPVLKGILWISSVRWQDNLVFSISTDSSTLCWSVFRWQSVIRDGVLSLDPMSLALSFGLQGRVWGCHDWSITTSGSNCYLSSLCPLHWNEWLH